MSPTSATVGGGMQFSFDSCLSECDCGIDRRPYHRNCGCALHKSKNRECLRKGTDTKNKVVFPIRRSWSEECLKWGVLMSSSGNSSPGSGTFPVVVVMGRKKTSMNQLMELCAEEDENEALRR